MTWMDWYNSLVKPDWTPAPATIGLIWQILYPIILVTFGFVFVKPQRDQLLRHRSSGRQDGSSGRSTS